MVNSYTRHVSDKFIMESGIIPAIFLNAGVIVRFRPGRDERFETLVETRGKCVVQCARRCEAFFLPPEARLLCSLSEEGGMSVYRDCFDEAPAETILPGFVIHSIPGDC